MADPANFGDSVHWGQGHVAATKFAHAVAVQHELTLQMNAHSGATIGANAACTGSAPGEVPFTTEEEVKRRTREYCHRDMTQLLRVVLDKFSNADTRVIVTSYFPIFSALSLKNPEGMEAFSPLT